MKKIVLMMLLALPIVACAQSENYFTLQPDGKMLSADGKEFVVIPFEGKTQSELYEMVLANVQKFTDMKTINKSENQSISIHMVHRSGGDGSERCSYYYLDDKTARLDIGYDMKFEFKDGKIKVVAPNIIGAYIFRLGKNIPKKFYRGMGHMAKDFYDDNKVKEKRTKIFAYVHFLMNDCIDQSIGKKKESEDW